MNDKLINELINNKIINHNYLEYSKYIGINKLDDYL